MLKKNISDLLNLHCFRSVFLHLLHFVNITHLHKKARSLIDDGKLFEYFNISSPVGRVDKMGMRVLLWVWRILLLSCFFQINTYINQEYYYLVKKRSISIFQVYLAENRFKRLDHIRKGNFTVRPVMCLLCDVTLSQLLLKSLHFKTERGMPEFPKTLYFSINL